MIQNEGAVDRAFRIGVGLLLVAIVFFGPQSAWLGIVGAVLVLTGLAGHCPVYGLFGLRTCRAST